MPPGAEQAPLIEALIREARVRDALSLWHLLPRVDAQSRRMIFDHMAQSLPPPAGVTRSGIVSLDSKMLDAWKTVVSQLWQ